MVLFLKELPFRISMTLPPVGLTVLRACMLLIGLMTRLSAVSMVVVSKGVMVAPSPPVTSVIVLGPGCGR